MPRLLTFLLFAVAQTVFWQSAESASAPRVFSYQGRLSSAAGEPFAAPAADLSFAIYDAETEGSLLWTEAHPATPVADGLFSAFLGSLSPLSDSLLAGPRWLEITVNGEPIVPRTLIGSAPGAFRVQTIDGATGGTITGGLTLLNPDYYPLKSPQASASSISLSFSDGLGVISLYDPVDSKSGAAEPTKRIEILRDGIIMFGATENDTNLFVAPNGDIIGRGQITMGENSSPGLQTSVLGFQNVANGDSSTIGGGSSNVTYGAMSVIAGGHENQADGEGSVISGGRHNSVTGAYATVAGGEENSAAGDFAVVPGGQWNQADGLFSLAAGRRAKALFDGSFVWADHTDEDFASTATDQFIIRASGGVGINTDSPSGALDVFADPVDSSVNLPHNAISSPEMFDEPGLAGNGTSQAILLPPGSPVTTVTTVTITAPADGFIHLTATATLETYGTSGRNQVYLQIDDSEGGIMVAPYFTIAGSGDQDSPNRRHYFSMNAQRIFPVTAGTYTFVLETQPHPQNDSDAKTGLLNPLLTATYYPTAYGSVSVSGLSRRTVK